MSVPMYRSVTDKVAREKLGVSTSNFDALVKDGHLLVDSLNTNKTFVCSASLDKYISVNGGREERLREAILKEIHNTKVKTIVQINRDSNKIEKTNFDYFDKIKSMEIFKDISSKFDSIIYTILEETKDNVEILKEKKISELIGSDLVNQLNDVSLIIKNPYANKIKQMEHSMSIIKLYRVNQKVLLKMYDLGFTDEILDKYFGANIDVDENFGKSHIEIKITEYGTPMYNFFNTYKSNKKQYENISYTLSYTIVKNIILKCRKKFK